MGEEIAGIESSLDEKEEESDEQKEDLPPKDSNSLNLTLYDILHAFLRRKNAVFLSVMIILKYLLLINLK